MGAVGSSERVVAGWVLGKRLGSGGYGEVWEARRRHVDFVRALKLMPIVDDGAFQSWRHEIQRLSALNHPNVVRFYDADIVSEGTYRDYAWIATELCERSLADVLSGDENGDGVQLLPGQEVERLLGAMLAALAAAHTAGMVHRDIKPANILRHSDGTWKLCDFGTARLVPQDATHPVTKVIGTSPYMSPAAHRGHQNQAADLYALGVTIHEALQGERLHPRPEGMTDGAYIKLVLDSPPTVSPALSRRWRTVVATLIGQHGAYQAAQLVDWFAETRGDRPPSPVASRGGASTGQTEAVLNGATAPTAAASPVGRNGNGAAPAHPVAAVSPAVPRVHVPAPRPPRAPAPRSAPPAGPPSPSPGPPAPQPQWADPTDVLGRRIIALVLDTVVVVFLTALFYNWTVVATHDKVPASGTENACAAYVAQYRSCVVIDDEVYVSATGIADRGAFAIPAVLVVFVVLQGMTGATVGKLVTGLRVVGPGGRRPGVLRAFARTLLWVVDGFPWVVPLVGWLVAKNTKYHRRVGDLVAGTTVVRRRALAHRP